MSCSAAIFDRRRRRPKEAEIVFAENDDPAAFLSSLEEGEGPRCCVAEEGLVVGFDAGGRPGEDEEFREEEDTAATSFGEEEEDDEEEERFFAWDDPGLAEEEPGEQFREEESMVGPKDEEEEDERSSSSSCCLFSSAAVLATPRSTSRSSLPDLSTFFSTRINCCPPLLVAVV